MSAREVPRSEELSSALDAARTRVESTSQVMSPYTARMAESTATSTVPVVDEQLAKKLQMRKQKTEAENSSSTQGTPSYAAVVSKQADGSQSNTPDSRLPPKSATSSTNGTPTLAESHLQSAWRVPDHKFNEVESALRKARVRSYGGSNSTTPTGSLAPTPVGTPSAAAAAHTPDVVPSAQPATSPPSAGSQKSVSMLKVDDVTLGLADHTPTTARAIADFNSPLPKHDPPTTMADHTPTTARAIAGLNSPLPKDGPPTTTSTTRLGVSSDASTPPRRGCRCVIA